MRLIAITDPFLKYSEVSLAAGFGEYRRPKL